MLQTVEKVRQLMASERTQFFFDKVFQHELLKHQQDNVVPGSKTSLLQAKAEGADIRMVYSPLDSLKIAKENYLLYRDLPDRHHII